MLFSEVTTARKQVESRQALLLNGTPGSYPDA